MKVRIKREQLYDALRERKFEIPEEIELEISEEDIVKEKSNREKWEEVFVQYLSVEKFFYVPVFEQLDHITNWISEFLDENCYDATKAYEKIVEGK